jgi:CDP-diacylglycerol--serine O-phosphatidyltransferase
MSEESSVETVLRGERQPMTVPSHRSPSMLRSYTPADLLTIANASCGTIAIFLCLDYMAFDDRRRLWVAIGLLPAALVFDMLDGYVARLNPRRQSVLGADLDSLADVISFGVGPAVLGYALGLRGGWDMACLTFFVVCGVSRLARFNVTAPQLTALDTGKVRHFEGTPIPTSIVIVALLALMLWTDRVQHDVWLGALRIGPMLLHPLALVYVLSGSAMVSTVRIPKP